MEEQRIVPWPRGLRTILSKQWLLTGQQSVGGREGDLRDITVVLVNRIDKLSFPEFGQSETLFLNMVLG